MNLCSIEQNMDNPFGNTGFTKTCISYGVGFFSEYLDKIRPLTIVIIAVAILQMNHCIAWCSFQRDHIDSYLLSSAVSRVALLVNFTPLLVSFNFRFPASVPSIVVSKATEVLDSSALRILLCAEQSTKGSALPVEALRSQQNDRYFADDIFLTYCIFMRTFFYLESHSNMSPRALHNKSTLVGSGYGLPANWHCGLFY